MSNRVKAKPGPNGRRPARGARGRPSWVIPVAVVALIGAAVLAIVLFTGGDDAPETVRVNGPSLPDLTAGGSDASIGAKAPVFQAAPLGGQVRTVGSGGGPNDPTRVYVFVTHWCDGCDDAVRAAAEVTAANGVPDGTVVEIITTADDAGRPNHPADRWVRALGWAGTVYPDSDRGTLAEAYGIVEFPSWVVLDNQNVVVTREVTTADLGALIQLAAG